MKTHSRTKKARQKKKYMDREMRTEKRKMRWENDALFIRA